MKAIPTSALAVVMSAAGFIVGGWWTRRGIGLGTDWPTVLASLSDIVQIIALVVAGAWTYHLFVRHRSDRIRADLTHRVQHYQLDAERRLVRVVLQIENVGNVELNPPAGEIEIRQVLPAKQQALAEIVGQDSPLQRSEASKAWPPLDTKRFDFKSDQLTLEPGECERYAVDFVIPSTLRVVEVHSVVQCGGSTPHEYWDETTLVSLDERSSAESDLASGVVMQAPN